MADILLTRISTGVLNPEMTLRPLMDLIVSVGSEGLALAALRQTIGLKDGIFLLTYLFFTMSKWRCQILNTLHRETHQYIEENNLGKMRQEALFSIDRFFDSTDSYI